MSRYFNFKASLTVSTLILTTVILTIPILCSAQSNSSDHVVGNVGNQNITYQEVKENFRTSDAEPTLEELEEFLPIYLNYRAKLKAAKDEGYFDDPELISEHEQYAKQASYSNWLQKEIKPQAFEQFYKRSQSELKTFHILIAANEEASLQEVEQIKEQLREAKEKIESGEPLEEIDQEYSSVRNGRSMGGQLPWISAGKTVSEFEDVAYNLDIGQVSEPFKTQFGYHIILLQDIRETTPARLVSHIFMRTTRDSTAYKKAWRAYNMLEEGKSWTEIVLEYTEDGASYRNNGRIGWVSFQNNFAEEFVNTINDIDPELPYTEPIETGYGYHIFRVDSVETFDSEEQRREKLMNQLNNTPYYRENNQFVVDYLKKKFASSVNETNVYDLRNFLSDQDSAVTFADLNIPTNLRNKIVFEFKGQSYTIADLQKYLVENYAQKKVNMFDNGLFGDFTTYIVDGQIIELTKEHFPDFEKQSKSYLEGLAVFQINDDYMWSAATVDTTRLLEIFEGNEDKYKYPERPHYYLITARHDSTLEKARNFVQKGGSPDSLRAHVNGLGLTSDSTTVQFDKPFDRLRSMEERSFSEVFDYRSRKGMFWLVEHLPERRKTFDEAFNTILSEFQPVRETEWLNSLRQKYNIKADLDALRKAYNLDS